MATSKIARRLGASLTYLPSSRHNIYTYRALPECDCLDPARHMPSRG